MSECYPDTDLSPADRREILKRQIIAAQKCIATDERETLRITWAITEDGTAVDAAPIRRLADLVEECSRLIRELDAMPEESADE